MTRTDISLSIQPEFEQFSGTPGTDLFVSSFSVAIPWYQGVVVQISAQGQIGSGVACTGLTPPGGWSEANVSGDTNWPFHGTGAHPYCLIGSLDRGSHWFFVGTGQTFALTAGGATLPLHDLPDPAPPPSPPPTAPAPWPPTRPLFFAVNRPDPMSLAIHADHQWDLVVTIIEPDWNPATMSWDNSQACPLVASQLSDTQGSVAAAACDAFETALRAVNDRWTLVDVAGGIASGCLIALVAAAAAVMAAAAAARAGAQQSSAAVIAAIIQAFEAATPSTPLATLLQTPVTINGTTTTLDALWGTATAAASPLADQPWTGVIIWGLAIALGISVVVAIGLLLSELTLAADVDNAHSTWEALTSNVQSLLDTLSALGCPAPADTSLPTCAAIGG